MIDQAREAYTHLTQGKVTNPEPEFRVNGDEVHVVLNTQLVGVYRPKSKQFMAPRKY